MLGRGYNLHYNNEAGYENRFHATLNCCEFVAWLIIFAKETLGVVNIMVKPAGLGWVVALGLLFVAYAVLLLYFPYYSLVRGLSLVIVAALAWKGQVAGGILAGFAMATLFLVDAFVSFSFHGTNLQEVFASYVILPAIGYLIGRLRYREIQLQLMLRRLQSAYAATVAMHSQTKLEDILQSITRIAAEDFDYGNASIFMKDHQGNFNLLSSAGHLADLPSGYVIKSGEGILGWVAEHRKPAIVSDVSKEPRYIPAVKGAKSQITIPLIIAEEVEGMLNIESEKLAAFSLEDQKALLALAEQAAVAIEKAKVLANTQYLAITDDLTGLYNHRFFKQKIREEITRARRFGSELTLLMLDMDDFKKINDTCGHPAGDRVLKEVAAIIRNTVRETDIPFRYGGEEFSVLLPQTGSQGAMEVAERLRQAIEAFSFPCSAGIVIQTTVSIGIATFPNDAANWSELVTIADSAMYRAKLEGKNTTCRETPLT